jgi:hypothetical protein
MKSPYIYILSIILLVACQVNPEKDDQINITVYNAYPQNIAYSYLYICDSLTKQYQIENPTGANQLLLIKDGSNSESNPDSYKQVQTNPLFDKITFNYEYDSFRREILTQSIFIGHVFLTDTQDVKNMLTIKTNLKKTPPAFIYSQSRNATDYYDLIALVNNNPVLKISNTDIDRIEIQESYSILNKLSEFTGENLEGHDYTISFKLNSSLINKLKIIKSDTLSKLYVQVNFFNKIYPVELNVEVFKKAQEIQLVEIFNKEDIEEIKKQYSDLIKK